MRISLPASAFYDARRRALRKGVPFTLTPADLPPVPEFCPILGIRLQRQKGTAGDASPSLDRIVPALGYIPGNVQWISNRANTIKSNATVRELRLVADYMERLLDAISDDNVSGHR